MPRRPGRNRHRRLDRIGGAPSTSDCDELADITGIPVNILSRVLIDGDFATPALAQRIRDVMHPDNRKLVTVRPSTPSVEYSAPSKKFGLPPAGYRGPTVIPVSKVEVGMLLMVSDPSKKTGGWLLVTKPPESDAEDRNSLKIETEHGTVHSANNMSVRVAAQAGSDSR